MTRPFDTAILATDPLPVLDAAGVAACLHSSEPSFLRKLRVLQREHGFPRQLPGLGRRWSRAQVLAWIEAGGVSQRAPAPVPAPQGLEGLIKRAEADLMRRYGGAR